MGMAVFVVSVVGVGATVRISETGSPQEQRYDKVRSSFIRISQTSAEILQSAFSFVQSDAEFVESGSAEPHGGCFWDKSEIGFYKIERLLHTIRDFGNKRGARESGIPLTLYSERSACGLPPPMPVDPTNR
ncbi:hypothetical protein B5G09_03670 [Alistipes sp. An54]|nr:hypothetical protein B5G09_03670 [Alistipes sp. An54]